METIGRKGRDFFRKRGARVVAEHIGILGRPRFDDAASIARRAIDRFRAGEIDAVYLLNNEFKSMVSQRLAVARLLPVEIPPHTEPVDYIFEQPPDEILDSLLPRYVETEVYRSMLETAAAEHAARMMAMEAATSNASEMIDTLTLYMNRVRQASITKEIIEVVSGAAAAAE
jgi:F-type H+-transporting ATPase subunit gamma